MDILEIVKCYFSHS